MTTYQTKPITFAELIAPYPADVQAIARRLRGLIQETLPDAAEHIYGGAKIGNALYSIGNPDNVICGIQPATDLCRLYVHNVHDLKHPELKFEGSGKSARHVKVRSVDVPSAEALQWLVGQAAAFVHQDAFE